MTQYKLVSTCQKWPSGGRWYAPKCVTPGVSAWGHRISISWHLTLDISWYFIFHVGRHIMSVNISCDLGDLSHHNNHSHQIHHGINVQNQFLLEKIPKINKWVPGGHLAPWNLTSHDIWHFMSIDISCRLTLHVGWHYMSVDITCRLTWFMCHVSCAMCHVIHFIDVI